MNTRTQYLNHRINRKRRKSRICMLLEALESKVFLDGDDFSGLNVGLPDGITLTIPQQVIV